MTTIIKIQNLKCGGCANTIMKKISTIENVTNVNVNIEKSTVTFDSLTQNEITIGKTQNGCIGVSC